MASKAPSPGALRCTVVGCEHKREKEGYCMSHYKIFKQPPSKEQEAAMAKAQKAQEKERARMHEEQAKHQRRATQGGGNGCFSSSEEANSNGAHPYSPPAPASDAPLVESLQRVWTTAHKVVFKDLPRLAKRTSLFTDAGVFVESGRLVRQHQSPAAASSSAAGEAAEEESASEFAARVDTAAIAARGSVAAATAALSAAAAAAAVTPTSAASAAARRKVEGYNTIDFRKANKSLWQQKWESDTTSGNVVSPQSRGSIAGRPAGASVASPLSPVLPATPAPSPASATAPASSSTSPPLSPTNAAAAGVAAILLQPIDTPSPKQSSQPSSPPASAMASPGGAGSPVATASGAATVTATPAVSPAAGASAAASNGISGAVIAAPASSVSPAPPAAAVGDVDTWQAVCNVVLTCVQALETPAVLDKAKQAFATASASMQVGSDHQSILEDIFTQSIGLYSRTYKIFQAIHQAILFPAIAYLHGKLYSMSSEIGTLKDVRRPDGWTVEIYVGAAVYITHQRWEQSLHAADSPLHFEVRWEMRLSFDREMASLRAVILRIQELRFHPQATAEHKKKITEVLTGSGYIV